MWAIMYTIFTITNGELSEPIALKFKSHLNCELYLADAAWEQKWMRLHWMENGWPTTGRIITFDIDRGCIIAPYKAPYYSELELFPEVE